MGYSLCGRTDNFHFNGLSWVHKCGVAHSWGWKPLGTEPPSYWEDEERRQGLHPWEGGYFSNDGQWVTDEDAANLADALETWLSHGLKGDGREAEDAPKLVTDFIAFCRKGGFLIW